ncbi:hypothetical protein JCM10207_002177, partial [Rhodosporidiobolus poonsookiae]
SGKSTICKQLKLIYGKPYSEEDRKRYTEIVFANTVQSAQAVLLALPGLSISLPSDLEPSVKLLIACEADDVCACSESAGPDAGSLKAEVGEALKKLWADERIKKAVGMSAQYQLNDSASYFFDALDRISTPGYIPTTQDVLRTRVRSTGIVEETFTIREMGGRQLTVVDVGGQRSERRKWIHCFENISLLIFVVSISEYAQKLFEDETVNRLDESAQLWESIVGSRWFSRTTFVLFLNKRDLFSEKMLSGRYPLSAYMPDYTGSDGDVAAGERYMKAKFTDISTRAAARGKDRGFFTHFTCATDTDSTRVVLSAVMNSVLTSRLEDVGML